MRASKTIVMALALGVSALITNAQPAGGPPAGGPSGESGGPGRGGHRPPPPPIIAALDVNKDHVISAEEIANAPAALAKLDKNGDGQLTPDELRPPRPADAPEPPQGEQPPEGAKRPVPPLIKALDADLDGIISAAEIANAAAALKTLDKNNDGQLTMEELRPEGGHRPPGGPGFGPPPGE